MQLTVLGLIGVVLILSFKVRDLEKKTDCLASHSKAVSSMVTSPGSDVTLELIKKSAEICK